MPIDEEQEEQGRKTASPSEKPALVPPVAERVTQSFHWVYKNVQARLGRD